MKRNSVEAQFKGVYQSKNIPVRPHVWEGVQHRLKHRRRKHLFLKIVAIWIGVALTAPIITEGFWKKNSLQPLPLKDLKTTQVALLKPAPIKASPFAIQSNAALSSRIKRKPLKLKRTPLRRLARISTASVSTAKLSPHQAAAEKLRFDAEAKKLLALVEKRISEEELQKEVQALWTQIENELAFERTLKGNLKKLFNAFDPTRRMAHHQN
jgi:hypothetical protein